MSEMPKERNPNFQFRNLTFIKSQTEELTQIENTVLMESVFNEYQQLVKLGSVLSKTQYGFTASSKESGNSKLLRITDLNEGSINWDSVPFCDCFEIEKYKINNGDILIARTGGTTGKTVLISQIDVDSVFASYLIRLTVGKEYNPEYVYIFLNSYLFWNQILELKNGTAQPNVNAEKMKRIQIPYCPLAVQNEIVSYKKQAKISTALLHAANEKFKRLKTLYIIHQSLFAENNTQSKAFAKLRQSILQEAIEGKLTADWRAENPVCLGDPNTDAAALLAAIQTEKQTLIAQGKLKKEKTLPPISNHEMPFALPEGWRWVSLLDVSFISGGMQKTQSRTPIKNFYPYLGVQNVQRGYLNLSQIKYFEATETELKKLKLVKNDLLIIEGNGSINEIGRCAIWNEEIENCIHQNHIMRCRPIISSQSSFIITVLNSNFGIAQMQEKARTTTGLFNLSVGKLSTVIIPLPPLAEQHEIVARVDRLLASVNALEQQVAERQRHAEQLMQAVLKEAFAG